MTAASCSDRFRADSAAAGRLSAAFPILEFSGAFAAAF
jgi:hypothetical protein